MKRNEFFSIVWKLFINSNPIFGALKTKRRKHRPPGALADDKQFRRHCTGCDACMTACPVNVIMIEDMDKRYPVIYPEIDPCIHCEGYPCIKSCPTAALHLSNS